MCDVAFLWSSPAGGYIMVKWKCCFSSSGVYTGVCVSVGMHTWEFTFTSREGCHEVEFVVRRFFQQAAVRVSEVRAVVVLDVGREAGEVSDRCRYFLHAVVVGDWEGGPVESFLVEDGWMLGGKEFQLTYFNYTGWGELAMEVALDRTCGLFDSAAEGVGCLEVWYIGELACGGRVGSVRVFRSVVRRVEFDVERECHSLVAALFLESSLLDGEGGVLLDRSFRSGKRSLCW